jgi:hypothetical protein
MKITHWDIVIDTNEIMKIANRILRKNGKMVLFAQDPFSTELKNKAIPNVPYSYSMIWEKNDFANALLSKKAPVNYYEDIWFLARMMTLMTDTKLEPILNNKEKNTAYFIQRNK